MDAYKRDFAAELIEVFKRHFRAQSIHVNGNDIILSNLSWYPDVVTVARNFAQDLYSKELYYKIKINYELYRLKEDDKMVATPHNKHTVDVEIDDNYSDKHERFSIPETTTSSF